MQLLGAGVAGVGLGVAGGGSTVRRATCGSARVSKVAEGMKDRALPRASTVVSWKGMGEAG